MKFFRSDNDDTEDDEELNDDDEINTSPADTLSNFWAKKHNETEKLRPAVRENERSRSDFIGLHSYQHMNQREDNRMVKTGDTGMVTVSPGRYNQHLNLLSHTAAKHRIAVKPKRNYSKSRKKKVQPNNISGQCEDLNIVATVNKLCGEENSSPKQNSFMFNHNSNLHDLNTRKSNCDITFQKSSQKKHEHEKLSNFLHRFIGSKKSVTKQPDQRNEAVVLQSNKSSGNQNSETKLQPPKGRTRKKPLAPPPPPTYAKPKLDTMNVKTINIAAGLLASIQNCYKKLNNYYFVDLKEPVVFNSPTLFSNLSSHNEQQNIILKRNASLGCLVSLEESHEKFHSSIQNWNLANEGFVKSLVSLPDSHPHHQHHQHPTDQCHDSYLSQDSLISMSSLLGGDSMVDEPDYMEETSLIITNNLPISQLSLPQVIHLQMTQFSMNLKCYPSTYHCIYKLISRIQFAHFISIITI